MKKGLFVEGRDDKFALNKRFPCKSWTLGSVLFYSNINRVRLILCFCFIRCKNSSQNFKNFLGRVNFGGISS